VHPRFHRFAPVFPEKRLELKSLMGRTKSEELGDLSRKTGAKPAVENNIQI
jgi:hypothetical protein